MSGIEVVLLVWMGVLTVMFGAVIIAGSDIFSRLGALEGKRRKPRAPKPPVSP